jgi:hypothetical protein
MQDRRLLSEAMPYSEKLMYAPSKGRPKITDAVWLLFPSHDFVDEVSAGNKHMASGRARVGGNKRESRLLPGFER